MDYDAIVIGGGPAGVTAAGWLGRYRRRTLLVDSGQYRNRWVEEIHGFYANDPTDPQRLRRQAHRDLEQYDQVEVTSGHVSDATRLEDGGFEITVDARPVRARRLVLATGVRDVFPDVAGFFEFYGSDVFHCPTCDGFDARGRCVAVFGWEAHVAGFAVELLDWADEIRIITNGRPLEIDDDQRRWLADHGIEVVDDEVVELLGTRGDLRGARLASGDRTHCTMGFFSIQHRPVTHLAKQLGCELDEEGHVRVSHEGKTSVAGVYAAGDLTGGMQLVGLAVGEGTQAGVSCAKSFHGEPPVQATPTPAPPAEDAVRNTTTENEPRG